MIQKKMLGEVIEDFRWEKWKFGL